MKLGWPDPPVVDPIVADWAARHRAVGHKDTRIAFKGDSAWCMDMNCRARIAVEPTSDTATADPPSCNVRE